MMEVTETKLRETFAALVDMAELEGDARLGVWLDLDNYVAAHRAARREIVEEVARWLADYSNTAGTTWDDLASEFRKRFGRPR